MLRLYEALSDSREISLREVVMGSTGRKDEDIEVNEK
jgi:hypothetical protein